MNIKMGHKSTLWLGKRRESDTKEMKWFPIKFRISSKVLAEPYKALTGPYPPPTSHHRPSHLPPSKQIFLNSSVTLPRTFFPQVFTWLTPHLSDVGLNVTSWEKPHLNSPSKANLILLKSTYYLLLIYFTELIPGLKRVVSSSALFLTSWLFFSTEAARRLISLYFQLLL